jgi:hypothetical protein
MKNISLLLFIAFALSSCHETVVQLKSSSPDGKTTITMNAKKASALDPYRVSLFVKSGDIPGGSLEFEITAGELNDSNVKFDWKDADNCVIKFTQSDGEVRTFVLQVSDTNVVLQEQKDANG